jgi:thiol-disulfide isomerase/thioredoxin
VGVVLLAARVVLGVVFLVAALAKLADRAGSRRAALDFGAPAKLAGPLSLAIPAAELAVVGALLPAGSAVWGAAGACALLALFSIAIGWNLSRGRTPDCHCFGQLHSEPAGWRTLVRNAALAGVALFVVIAGWGDPGPSAVDWIAHLGTAEALAAGALAVAVAVLAGAAWAVRRLKLQLDALEERAGYATDAVQGLPVGAAAPEFVLPDVEGEQVSLPSLRALGRSVLLLFVDSGCAPCDALLPEVARWQSDYGDLITFAVISGGRRLDVRAKAEEHGLEFVLCDEQRSTYRAYEGSGKPSAVLVYDNGTIASVLAAGAKAVTNLVESLTGRPEQAAALPVGTTVANVTARTLNGERTELSRFRGAETLFLVWSPDCEFCREIHDELVQWEVNPPPDAPRLVVVAAGEAEELREEGFRATVLFDADGKVRRALGARGAPSALLVDAEGRVAWPLASGSGPVLRLVRSRAAATVRA